MKLGEFATPQQKRTSETWKKKAFDINNVAAMIKTLMLIF